MIWVKQNHIAIFLSRTYSVCQLCIVIKWYMGIIYGYKLWTDYCEQNKNEGLSKAFVAWDWASLFTKQVWYSFIIIHWSWHSASNFWPRKLPWGRRSGSDTSDETLLSAGCIRQLNRHSVFIFVRGKGAFLHPVLQLRFVVSSWYELGSPRSPDIPCISLTRRSTWLLYAICSFCSAVRVCVCCTDTQMTEGLSVSVIHTDLRGDSGLKHISAGSSSQWGHCVQQHQRPPAGTQRGHNTVFTHLPCKEISCRTSIMWVFSQAELFAERWKTTTYLEIEYTSHFDI